MYMITFGIWLQFKNVLRNPCMLLDIESWYSTWTPCICTVQIIVGGGVYVKLMKKGDGSYGMGLRFCLKGDQNGHVKG